MESSGDYRTSLADYIFLKAHHGFIEGGLSLLGTEANFNEYLHRTYSKPHDQNLTVLTMACLESRPDIVRILLEHFELDLEVLNDVYLTPQDEEAKMFYGVTVLWVAAASDNFELVELLVKRGARVNHTTKTSSTAIRCACCAGNLTMARYLVQNGADVRINKEHHDTNLSVAAFKRHLEVVRYLIQELGCDINECDEEGSSPLYEAVRSESIEVVEYLLQQGARNFRAHSNQLSPLLLAATKRRIDLVDMISSQCSLLEQIEGKELLGSSFACEVDHRYDREQSFTYLSQALELRSLHQLPKVLTMPTLEIFGHRQECETVEQLEHVFKNTDDIHIEALLIRERVLGTIHTEYVHSLRLWGASLLDNNAYERGLAVWMYAAHLHRENSLPLKTDNLRCFVSLFSERILESLPLSAESVQTVFNLLLEELNVNTTDFDDHLYTLLFLITLTALVKCHFSSPSSRRKDFSRFYTNQQTGLRHIGSCCFFRCVPSSTVRMLIEQMARLFCT